MNREPTTIVAAVAAVLSSVTKLAVLMGWVDWTVEQLAQIDLVVNTTLILLGALFIRSQVTPIHDPRLEVGSSVNHGHATVVATNEGVVGGREV